MTSTAPTKIDALHWNMLVDRIHDGRCVPLLGAGVNASTADYHGLPLGNEVTLRLLEMIVGKRVSKIQDLIEVKVDPILSQHEGLIPDTLLELSWVAEYFRQASDSQYLLEALHAILAERDRHPSQILETLAGLPFRLIITCNYDRLMERALEKTGVQYSVVVQPTDGFDEQSAHEARRFLEKWTGCVLYKLHGSFTDYEGESRDFIRYNIVLTEDDYIVFMGTLSSHDRGMPLPIKAQLMDCTVLFLGYSLRDWDWRMFYGLLPHSQRRMAISIQKDPPSHWVRYWNSKGLMIYNIDLGDFAQELSSRFAERY